MDITDDQDIGNERFLRIHIINFFTKLDLLIITEKRNHL